MVHPQADFFDMAAATIPFTQAELSSNFEALGVVPGQVIMLHSSVKAVGRVMGGPNVILQALLDTLTPTGTLMMYAGWQDIPDFLGDLPVEDRTRFYENYPAFDAATARAVRENSILAEFLRTWPGARRSANPEASIVAVGAQADWITRDHPLNYGYGPGSPFEKLARSNGFVLLLGAPLHAITLLHYAENRARMHHKNVIRYQYAIVERGNKVWIDIEDYNTGHEHDDYTLEQITQAYLSQNPVRRGKVGEADSYLFDAADLADFAITWLESRFGS